MTEFMLKAGVEDVKDLAERFVIPGITDSEAEDIIVLLNENPEIVKSFEQSIMNEIDDYIHKNPLLEETGGKQCGR